MADYEITNARKWDLNWKENQRQGPTSSGWKVVEPQPESIRRRDPPKNIPGSTPRKWNDAGRHGRRDRRERQPARLIEHSDNEAEALWRANQPAADTVKIPDDLILKDKEDKSEKQHEIIAKQHGTYIYTEHAKGFGGSRLFGIWGEKAAATATKLAIAAWVDDCGYGAKSSRSAKFAKVVSLTPKLRERAERTWEREVRKQRFRRHPPMGMAFGAIASFHWPIKEYRPEEILGTNFEAFDPIRMDTSCYVVFVKAWNVFRVMGKPSAVKEGVQSIRQTCFQIAARQLNPVRQYLLQWSDPTMVPLSIYTADYKPPAILSSATTNGGGEVTVRKSPCGDEFGHHPRSPEQAAEQTRRSDERLRLTVLRTLSKLNYYRGYVQMRVRLGTFLAVQYMEAKYDCYDLDEYETMLQASQFSGEVTQELGHRATEQDLLPALLATTKMVTPSEATVNDLRSVKPIYTVSFTFRDSDGHYRLTVEWHETFDEATNKTHFEETSKKWTRLDRDCSALTSLLDVSLCDLSDGSAWQFDVLASPQVIDEAKLSPNLLAFTRNLRIEPDAAAKARRDEVFVRFNPFANLASFQQRITFQYAMVNSDYTLELSRFQDRTYLERTGSPLKGPTGPTVTEPRWSVNVFRKSWDAMLADNERLPIGKQVSWQPDVATWFPYDIGPGSTTIDEKNLNQGWEQLMEKLKQVELFVRDVKATTPKNADEDEEEEPLMKEEEEAKEEHDFLGGMTVG
ncbi:hypothetical protein LTS10_011815 [Elasticomyces elasticus]|nr:hypothetical protein LTS10_011815 [Elasticomyces elasticus]